MHLFVKKKWLKLFVLFVVITGVCGWLYNNFFSTKIQNVVVISIDTCRADFLSCYGLPLETTPNIDSIAKEGLLCEQTICPVPFTLPAHCSMHTGSIPLGHGVLDNGTYTLAKDNITLAEMLKEQGFSTGAFISSYILDSDFGMDQGFDTYNDNFKSSRNTMGILERQGEETSRLAVKWLEEHRDEKQFLFVHYYDPHFSYDAPEPFGSKFASAELFKSFPPDRAAQHAGYAGEIAYVDHCIGKIIDKLKELGQYDSTLICITSDHGEMLGQHGENTHGYFIYKGNIDVPLVLKIPGRKKPLRIKNTVGLVDIVPTICSAIGIEIKHKIQGKDLLAYYDNNNSYPDRYLFTQSLEPTKYDANPLLGVVKDQYKYIQTTNSELYDLGKDKYELKNLVKDEPKMARLMEGELLQILEDVNASKKADTASGVDSETLANLESLGYVGTEVDDSFVIDPEKEEPKDLIGYHVMAMQIGHLLQAENYEAAENVCRKMIEEKPDQYMGYYKMAICLAEKEDHAGSVEYLLKMAQLDQDNPFAYAGLAECYRKLEQYDTAIKHAIRSLELSRDSIGAYYDLCVSYYGKGMFDEPSKHITREIIEHPQYSELVASLAEKLYEKGQIRRAYKKYSKVLEIDPESFDGLNSVAWFQAASTIEGIRNPQQAVANALKACQIADEKQEPIAFDTLAVAYAAAGDFQKAIETAQKAIEIATSNGENALAGRIQKRLKLYKNGKPYKNPQL